MYQEARPIVTPWMLRSRISQVFVSSQVTSAPFDSFIGSICGDIKRARWKGADHLFIVGLTSRPENSPDASVWQQRSGFWLVEVFKILRKEFQQGRPIISTEAMAMYKYYFQYQYPQAISMVFPDIISYQSLAAGPTEVISL